MMKFKPLAILALFAFLLTACSGVLGQEVAPIKGAIAPDFTLTSLSGEEVSLSDFRGQPVLVNFWATWCGPCRLEMPAIQDRYQMHQPDLVVLAVNLAESAEQVSEFVDELGLTFDPLLDADGSIFELYQVLGYPSSYFIDPDGIIQAVHIGFMTEGQLDENIALIGIDIKISLSELP